MATATQIRPPSQSATRTLLSRLPSSTASTSSPTASSSRPVHPVTRTEASQTQATSAPRRALGAGAPSAGNPSIPSMTIASTPLEPPAEGIRTLKRPNRVVQTGESGHVSYAVVPSTLKRSALAPPSSSSRSLGCSTLSSSTSLRTLPSTASKRLPTSKTISEDTSLSLSSSQRGVVSPDLPLTPRTTARTRSIASQALSRSLSRSTSGRGLAKQERSLRKEESPQTVRPARRVLGPKASEGGSDGKADGTGGEEKPPRKKPALVGLGRPTLPTQGKEVSLSPDTVRQPSRTLRSASHNTASTPLRSSTRRPSTSTSAARETAMKPPPAPSSAFLSSRTHRRTPAAPSQSSIPIPSSAALPSATLSRLPKKPSSTSLSVASSAHSEASSQHSAILGASALRRRRVEGKLGGPLPPPSAPGTVRRVSGALGRSPGRRRASAAGRESKIPPRPRASRADQPPPPSANGQDNPQDDLSASQIGRRDSWVTEPGSARPSLSSADPLPSIAFSSSNGARGGTGEGDISWETVESRCGSAAAGTTVPFPPSSASSAPSADYATPRRSLAAFSGANAAPLNMVGSSLPSRSSLSYISPDTSTSRFSQVFLSPTDSPPIHALLSVSQSSQPSLSPGFAPNSPITPRPRQVSLLRQTGKRNKPRDSASLEEILRLGLQNGDSGARELELLLDEGSSVLMREDLEAEGMGGLGLGVGAEGGTPWRGRVLSLSTSPGGVMRKSLLAQPPQEMEKEERDEGEEKDGVREDQDLSEDEQGDDMEQQTEVFVLPLRPSTLEATELRRQLEALQGEMEQLRAARLAGAEEAAARVVELQAELDAHKVEQDEQREEWKMEREGMEADLAELAAAAASSQPLPAPTAPSRSSTVDISHRSALELSLSSLHFSCASSRVATGFEQLESRAKRDREDSRGEVEMIRALMGGLKVWEEALVRV
ncbi:hypothetical protein JCM11641_002532 [Rhodosporidiobolus odoratus]